MRIALDSANRKGVFLGSCAALALLGALLTTQTFVEYCLTRSISSERLRIAARIQPLNALHEEMLGAFYMDPSVGEFQSAAAQFETAVRINPHSSRAWLNLANCYEVLGDRQHSSSAILRALSVEPKESQVQWEAANLLIASDLDHGLNLLRGVFESDPRFAPAVMQVAFRASGNDLRKLMLAIPHNGSARLAAMRWLLNHDQPDAADQVWLTAASAGDSWRPQDAFFYFDSLLQRHKVAEAKATWRVFLDKDQELRSRVGPERLVVNGDFESNLLNGGFGWRFVPTGGVKASLDTSTFREGTRSLLLQVDGDGIADCGIYEYVPVEPGGRYGLSGWLHAEELLGAHGIRIAVVDAYSGQPLLLTDDALGSFAWRQYGGEFQVPNATELVKLSLLRSPSNGLVRGRIWFDDVRLEKR